MSPFRTKDNPVYRTRVHDARGARYVRTLGTRDKAEATAVEVFVKKLRRDARFDVLARIIDGTLPALEAYHAALAGTLAQRMVDLSRHEQEADDADLSPLVSEWARLVRGKDYVRQVRHLIPEGVRFPASQFTRRTLSEFLANLPHANPTRNRYRTALMQFARWLVEREVLDANPVRDVRGYKEHDPRMVHYTRDEARALIRRLPPTHQLGEAFMAGAGMELGAVLALRRRDVDLATRRVMAHGTKNRWRKREVKVTEDWCWAIIAERVREYLPDAPLFPGAVASTWLREHKRACETAGVPVSTLHDWRHTYAVQALKDGIAPQTVRRQLGHAPGSLELERVYGAWLPKADADYAPRVATEMATPLTNLARTEGAK